MIARWLCGWLAAEVLIVALAVGWAARAGLLHPAGAVGAAIVGFLVLASVPIAGAYLVALVCARRTPGVPYAGLARRTLAVLGEWLAYLALFVVIQPLARLWMGGDAVGRLAPGQVPVLLVHGFFCNRGFWWWLRRSLRARRFAVATIDLEPPFAGIDRFADQLHTRIEALLAETGAGRVVLIGHSMGGLAARAYLQRHGAGRVERLVTLGSPHHGSRMACLGVGTNAREIRPNSAWLRALNAQPLSVPALSVWSTDDEFVIPRDSSRLPGARQEVVSALGHLAKAFSPRIRAILIAELTPDKER